MGSMGAFRDGLHWYPFLTRASRPELFGTARCGPARRGGVGPGADLLGQSPGTRFGSIFAYELIFTRFDLNFSEHVFSDGDVNLLSSNCD